MAGVDMAGTRRSREKSKCHNQDHYCHLHFGKALAGPIYEPHCSYWARLCPGDRQRDGHRLRPVPYSPMAQWFACPLLVRVFRCKCKQNGVLLSMVSLTRGLASWLAFARLFTIRRFSRRVVCAHVVWLLKRNMCYNWDDFHGSLYHQCLESNEVRMCTQESWFMIG